jgi:hypothetical protein
VSVLGSDLDLLLVELQREFFDWNKEGCMRVRMNFTVKESRGGNENPSEDDFFFFFLKTKHLRFRGDNQGSARDRWTWGAGSTWDQEHSWCNYHTLFFSYA